MNTNEMSREDIKKGNWLGLGFLISLILGLALYGLVVLVKNNYIKVEEDVIESEENIDWLFCNNRILYKELYQKISGEMIRYGDLYLEEKEGYEYDPNAQGDMDEEEYKRWRSSQIQESRLNLERRLESQAAEFNESGQVFDYGIRDTKKNTVHSNLSVNRMPQIENYGFYISFIYDENGNVRLGEKMAGSDVDSMRRYANMAIRNRELYEYEYDYMTLIQPRNCEIVYAMASPMIDKIETGSEELMGTRYRRDWSDLFRYYWGEMFILWGALLSIPFFLAWLLPQRVVGRGYEDTRACRIALEWMGCWGILFCGGVQASLTLLLYGISGEMTDFIGRYTGIRGILADSIVALTGILGFALTGLIGWYLGICLRPVRDLGVWEYFKQRCLVFRLCKGIKKSLARLIGKIYRSFVEMNLEKDLNKKLLLVAGGNCAILAVGSLLFGVWNEVVLLLILLYSVGIFFLMRKYMKDLQHQYSILMHAVDQMAQGNLNANMEEDMGVLEPLRPKLMQIQNGFRQAVEEEVKSQKMKAELITNVSHDLKTPLTAIITYIGLLRDQNVTPDQREEYMNTLESKSLRLKMLIEDLFEVSKANTGNISLNLMEVDLVNLVKQAHAEAQRVLEERHLDVRMRISVQRMVFTLDSQKAYRIYENLFHNVAKYAMAGTRVYVDGGVENHQFYISIKNISEQELTLTGEELADRFVRGDISRNTEGSGLGLAIARSFTQLMGGRFEITADGDLFKVTTWWPMSSPAGEP